MPSEKPTHQDADLLIKLISARALMEVGDPDAQGWIWGDEFIPDYKEFKEKFRPGSVEWRRVHGAAGFFESLGTLVRNDLLNENLLYDWIFVVGSWDRMKDIMRGWREETVPAMYENFEWIAERQRTWKPTRA